MEHGEPAHARSRTRRSASAVHRAAILRLPPAAYASADGARADRHLLVGRRRAQQALVPEGPAGQGAARLVRGALLDGRGRLDLLPRARRADGAGLGRPHPAGLRHPREGLRADDPPSGAARAAPARAPRRDAGRRARPRRPPRARAARGSSSASSSRALEPLRAAGKLGGILFQMPPYIVPKPGVVRLPRVGPRRSSAATRCSSSSATATGSRRTAAPRCSAGSRSGGCPTSRVDAPRLDAANVPQTLVAATGPTRLRPLPRPERRDLEQARRRRGAALRLHSTAPRSSPSWVEPLRELCSAAEQTYAFFNNNNQTDGVAQAPAGGAAPAAARGGGRAGRLNPNCVECETASTEPLR